MLVLKYHVSKNLIIMDLRKLWLSETTLFIVVKVCQTLHQIIVQLLTISWPLQHIGKCSTSQLLIFATNTERPFVIWSNLILKLIPSVLMCIPRQVNHPPDSSSPAGSDRPRRKFPTRSSSTTGFNGHFQSSRTFLPQKRRRRGRTINLESGKYIFGIYPSVSGGRHSQYLIEWVRLRRKISKWLVIESPPLCRYCSTTRASVCAPLSFWFFWEEIFIEFSTMFLSRLSSWLVNVHLRVYWELFMVNETWVLHKGFSQFTLIEQCIF